MLLSYGNEIDNRPQCGVGRHDTLVSCMDVSAINYIDTSEGTTKLHTY